MSLAVIVTRTLPGARDTAETLRSLGYTPILSPMLRIVETGFDPGLADGIAHIVFTSANGVHAVAAAKVSPDIRVWCVGPSTADAARAAGYANVGEGDGNADDLARLILSSGAEGPILHVANEAAAGNMVTTLRAAGRDARFCAPYRTEAEASLSSEARAALAAASPVLLLVHSAKASGAVAASAPDLSRAAIAAISAAALEPLRGTAGLGEWIAARPNDSDLMQAVSAAAAALSG